MRNLLNVLPSGCINLHSHRHHRRVTFLQIFAALASCCLFENSHSGRCEVISDYRSDLHFLMISDVRHIFMCLLTFVYSHLEKCLFLFSAHFSVVCLMLSCICSLYILDINPLSDILFANIFSHSVGGLFVLLIVSFVVERIFLFDVVPS